VSGTTVCGWALCLFAGWALCAGAPARADDLWERSNERAITALGRLEPKDGVIRVAGPSRPAVVIDKLMIEEGDRVEKGQRIAVLDSYQIHEAAVARLTAQLDNAEREFKRIEKLHSDGIASVSVRDDAEMNARVARADLKGAKAEFDRSVVGSPLDGQVLEIHARTGERVGPDGIAELGRTDEMYAVAEVYETDIAKVAVGARARVSSPAFAEPIGGVVERIALKVGKMDVLDVDPAARTDARVVEVEIRLDGDADVSGLTNLQVEVEILP